jgi:hypothetical protein
MGTEKNHYIPIFYLSAWTTAPKGELHVYERPSANVVRRRRHPAGTAYVKGLYTAPLPVEEEKYWIEDVFLKAVDDAASRAHKLMLANNLDAVQGELKTAWSRFIIATWHRNPEKVTWLKSEWAAGCAETFETLKRTEHEWAGKPGCPVSLDEYVRSGKKDADDLRGYVRLHQTIMDSERVGQQINSMRWSTIRFQHVPELLLTSDRPIVMFGGLASGYFVMPISPNHLFVAHNTPGQLEELNSWGGRPLVARTNGQIVRQTQRFVFSNQDNMGAFVEARLNKFPDEVRRATFHR